MNGSLLHTWHSSSPALLLAPASLPSLGSPWYQSTSVVNVPIRTSQVWSPRGMHPVGRACPCAVSPNQCSWSLTECSLFYNNFSLKHSFLLVKPKCLVFSVFLSSLRFLSSLAIFVRKLSLKDMFTHLLCSDLSQSELLFPQERQRVWCSEVTDMKSQKYLEKERK